MALSAVRKRAFDAGVVVWEDPVNEPDRLRAAGVRFRVLAPLECPSPIWVSLPGKLTNRQIKALQEAFSSIRDENVLNRLDFSSQLVGFVAVRVSDYDPVDQQLDKASAFDSP